MIWLLKMFKFNSKAKVLIILSILCLSLGGSTTLYSQEKDKLSGAKYEVLAAKVDVYANEKVIGTIKKGEIFIILDQSEDWLLIEMKSETNRKQKGWVDKNQGRVIENDAVISEDKPKEKSEIEFHEIIADGTDVSIEEKVLATLHKGDLVKLLDKQSNWGWCEIYHDNKVIKGWIKTDKFKKFQDKKVPPSQFSTKPSKSGTLPISATAAVYQSDWNSKAVAFNVTLPLSTVFQQIQLDTNLDNISKISRRGKIFSFSVEAQNIPKILSEDSRSFWIKSDFKGNYQFHRIDLPELELSPKVTSYKYQNFDEGLVVSIPVTGLLPDYELQVAIKNKNGSYPYSQISEESAEGIRIADITREDNRDVFRIIIPFLDNKQETVEYLLFAKNVDGSISNTIKIIQRGNSVESNIVDGYPSEPKPIDAVTNVPSLAYLSIDDAISQLKNAGLRPILIAHNTYQRVIKDKPSDWIVLSQGIVPEENIMVDSPILVSVGPLNSKNNQAFHPLTQSIIDCETENDIVALPKEITNIWYRIHDIDFDESNQSDKKTNVSPNSFVDRAFDSGSEKQQIDETLLNHNQDDGDSKSDTEQLLVLPEETQISLNMERSKEEDFAVKLHNSYIRSIINRPDPKRLPGVIGEAITESLIKYEAAVQNKLSSPSPSLPIHRIGSVLFSKTQVELSDSQKENIDNEWNSEFSNYKTIAEIDHNKNLVVVDDILIWSLNWLMDHKLYDPSAYFQQVPGETRRKVIKLYKEKHDNDWVSAFFAKKLKKGKTHKLFATSPKKISPVLTNPNGSYRTTPSLVRIPNVLEDTIEVAQKNLLRLGIQILNGRNYFLSDKIHEIEPKSLSWITPEKRLIIEVKRKVPNITGIDLAPAKEKLKRWRLSPHWNDAESFDDDLVFKQDPKAGEYVFLDKNILLDLRVRVPDLIDLTQKEASNRLKKKDLGWKSDGEAFESDKVVGQSPKSTELARHGDEVVLHLRLKVPSVDNGLTLGTARQSLKDWDLNIDVPNKLAREKDIVKKQYPAAGTYVDHQSTVELKNIVTTVPNVKGKTVTRATRELSVDEDLLVKEYGNVRQQDEVMRTFPSAGHEIERGETITLDCRVAVPNLSGTISRAKNIIDNLPNDIEINIVGGSIDSDFVYSQSPDSNAFVYPRETINIIPGVNVPRLRGLSPNIAVHKLKALDLPVQVTTETQETFDRGMDNRIVIASQNVRAGFYPRSDIGIIRLNSVRYRLAIRNVPHTDELRADIAIKRIQAAHFVPVIQFWYDGITYKKRYTVRDFAILLAKIAVRRALRGAKDRANIEVIRDSIPRSGTSLTVGSVVVISVDMTEYMSDVWAVEGRDTK